MRSGGELDASSFTIAFAGRARMTTRVRRHLMSVFMTGLYLTHKIKLVKKISKNENEMRVTFIKYKENYLQSASLLSLTGCIQSIYFGYMKTMLNIKIDVDVKREAKKTAEAMGIPLSTIANILLRQFAREKEINLSLSYKPSAYLKQSIKEAEEEYKEGKTCGPYKGVDALMKALRK